MRHGKRNVNWGEMGGWGGYCLFACMWISMKLDILLAVLLPFLPVVRCTLGFCTEIPTRARICDRWHTQLSASNLPEVIMRNIFGMSLDLRDQTQNKYDVFRTNSNVTILFYISPVYSLSSNINMSVLFLACFPGWYENIYWNGWTTDL